MTYERFLKITLGLQKAGEDVNKLHRLNVDLIDFVDPYHAIINELMKEVYGEEGYEWWSWFCYESEYGQRDWSKYPSYKTDENGNMVKIHDAGEIRFGATDEEGNPICYSFESTWEYLEKNYKKIN